MIWKYLLLVYGLSLYFLNCVVGNMKVWFQWDLIYQLLWFLLLMPYLKFFAYLKVKSYFPMIYFKNFIFFALTCRSIISFQLIFVYAWPKDLFICLFCMWISNCPHTICWKVYHFCLWIALASLLKISWCKSLFMDSQFCPSLISILFLVWLPHCVGYFGFIVHSEISSVSPSNSRQF